VARRAAINALRRARRAAMRAGIDLTDWEGEFLTSVEARVEQFGRAFADPDKGSPGTSLSVRQGVKLREISAKAKGKPHKRGLRPRS
jgi:DNA-directed RNA polymerase specialized sigma24 family protein